MELTNLNPIIEKVESESVNISDVVESTVKAYTEPLNKVMEGITNDLVNVDNPPISVIEKYFLELSNAIYFVSETTEKVGVFDGVSRALAREIYNNAYVYHQNKTTDDPKAKKPTVGESTAYAESEALENTMVNEIYSRAYKIIKAKVASAETMVSTLSKILSRRMAENQFSGVNNNTRQILNEEVPGAIGTGSYTPF